MCKDTFIVIAFAALLHGLLGCQITSQDRVSDTRSMLSDMREELFEGKEQIDRTMATLRSLTLHQGNLIDPYEEFEDQMGSMQSHGEAMNALVEEMQANSQVYFEGWDDETSTISNEEVRKRSMKRMCELKTIYGEIEEAMMGTRRVYEPFISDLKDLQRFLKSDLSEGGIAAISDLIQKTEQKATTVKSWIDVTINTLHRADQAMSSERK
jgi:hypothetical protein